MLPPVEVPARGVAIAGAGPVARAFGRAMRECGTAIACVASRDFEHAAAAAALIGGGAAVAAYREIPRYASHVLVAVSDRAILPVAAEIARGEGTLRAALHTCGSYGPEALEPLQAAGVSCGSLHPLQTIPEGSGGAAALREAAFAVCGEGEALRWAEEVAAALSGCVLHIEAGARPFYHAAAVMASNYVATLLDAAGQLMRLAGVEGDEARRALAPLARTSLDNAVRRGPREALTGPIVRGDAETVAAHVRALAGAGESVAELYRAAGLHALEMARRRGLGGEEAERVRKALGGRRQEDDGETRR